MIILAGPCRRDDRCESCGQSERNCPGHFGHIRLPVPVFNPMFFKTLLQVRSFSLLFLLKFLFHLIDICMVHLISKENEIAVYWGFNFLLYAFELCFFSRKILFLF